ncbi:hypothetical protein Droror1_Dr00027423 [Drosera rotundifolia]
MQLNTTHARPRCLVTLLATVCRRRPNIAQPARHRPRQRLTPVGFVWGLRFVRGLEPIRGILVLVSISKCGTTRCGWAYVATARGVGLCCWRWVGCWLKVSLELRVRNRPRSLCPVFDSKGCYECPVNEEDLALRIPRQFGSATIAPGLGNPSTTPSLSAVAASGRVPSPYSPLSAAAAPKLPSQPIAILDSG